jgi:hypothetical protein
MTRGAWRPLCSRCSHAVVEHNAKLPATLARQWPCAKTWRDGSMTRCPTSSSWCWLVRRSRGMLSHGEVAWSRARWSSRGLSPGTTRRAVGAGVTAGFNLAVKSPSQGATPASRRQRHPRLETIEAVLLTRDPTLRYCSTELVDAGHHHAPRASPRLSRRFHVG